MDPSPADALPQLEEKIRRAVELVTQLRRDKEAALQMAADSGPLKAKVEELTREVESLRAERDEVRKRIGKLLEQIDSLHTL
ncbi:MAG: cell division protein ZapB [Acidimicrobiia bacterium]|nr:cell division protein ZapB [Acidimicrobiia bacterium]